MRHHRISVSIVRLLYLIAFVSSYVSTCFRAPGAGPSIPHPSSPHFAAHTMTCTREQMQPHARVTSTRTAHARCQLFNLFERYGVFERFTHFER